MMISSFCSFFLRGGVALPKTYCFPGTISTGEGVTPPPSLSMMMDSVICRSSLSRRLPMVDLSSAICYSNFLRRSSFLVPRAEDEFLVGYLS